MNSSELESLIRTIVHEQLVPVAQTSTTSARASEVALFTDVDSAIQAAHQAFLRYQESPLKTRSAIIAAIRHDLAPHLAELSERAADETGMGNKADKIQKNTAALNNTPGIEDLKTTALTGDEGMVLFEYSPFGVIGSVAPSTNPTETIINNTISMLAAGNTVYFSPHPGAKQVSLWLVSLLEDIAFKACGIHNLIVTLQDPTVEATQKMMAHPLVAVLAITGGPAIVGMAMKSGKKVIGAGAGNPPCLVDETAEIVKAAQDIVAGASFDYNIPCIAEKSVIAVDCIANQLIQQMQAFGAMLITDRQQIASLHDVCIQQGNANKKLIGKSPATILQAAGIPCPPQPPRLIILETPADDSFVMVEQLMPVLPIVRVNNFEEGLQLALKVERGLHHTAQMHSQNVSRLNKAAQRMQTSIFVKNGPSYAGIGVGAEGFTTFTIATPTGEGTTSARTFGRLRRCVLTNGFSIR